MNTMKKAGLLAAGSLMIMGAVTAQNLKQALKYTENEQFELASQVFHKLIAEKPNDAHLYFYMGENMYHGDRLDSALFYYEKGISINPNYGANYVGKGKIYLAKGDEANANPMFAKARDLSAQKDPVVHIEIADAYISTEWKSMAVALQELLVAEKHDAKDPNLYLLRGDAILYAENDGSVALTNYETAMGLDATSPKPHIHIGNLYERGRSYDLAFEEYNAAIKLDSSFAPSYRKLGELYFKYGNYDKAIENYKKYLQLTGNSFSARVKYSKILYLGKEYQPAVNEMLEIMKIDSTQNILNRLLGYSYYELKQYETGMTYMQKFFAKAAASGNKLLAEDYKYRGKLYAALKNDSLAIPDYKQAIEMDTTMLDVYGDLATSYINKKQYDDAITTLNKKMGMVKSPSVNDLFKVGQAYYSKGIMLKDSISYSKADSMFALVLVKQPELLVAHLSRARANAAMDPATKLGLAKPHYEKVIELAAADVEKNKKTLVEAHYYLAYYYYQMKDKANATLNNSKVLQYDPANTNAPVLQKNIDKLQ